MKTFIEELSLKFWILWQYLKPKEKEVYIYNHSCWSYLDLYMDKDNRWILTLVTRANGSSYGKLIAEGSKEAVKAVAYNLYPNLDKTLF